MLFDILVTYRDVLTLKRLPMYVKAMSCINAVSCMKVCGTSSAAISYNWCTICLTIS